MYAEKAVLVVTGGNGIYKLLFFQVHWLSIASTFRAGDNLMKCISSLVLVRLSVEVAFVLFTSSSGL